MDSAQISWIQRKYQGFNGNLMDSTQISWIQSKSNGFSANLMDSAQISWIQRRSSHESNADLEVRPKAPSMLSDCSGSTMRKKGG